MNHRDELPLAKVSEVDEAKRQWLQGMRHPVDTVTEPEPAEILAEFIRQHSAAGQLVARAVFLSPPYSVAEEELSVLLESIKQNGDYADIACMTGSQDDYYYSTQAMSENYAAMSLQVVEQDICRAIAHAVRFECQTYPRPYKVAMLMQAPYYFQEAQIEAAIAAMDVAPEYADIRQVESSTAVLYLFSERFMTYGKAYGLCEWFEVEQFQNPCNFREMSWIGWTVAATALGDNQMSFTRRKFVLGMGTVIFFTGSASSLLANTRQEKEVRYAMIHDESRCNGCNICARACRKTNHVPAQGSRLSIAHIPVTDNDNETQYHFFRQSCQHCEDAPCIDVCPTGASWRDEQGIVRVEKSQCIGCSYCIGACPYQVRYLNPVTKVADKCDFCAESRLAKGFPPICVSACPEHALIFGREDSPEIQAWLQDNKYYQYQLPGAGKPHLYRRFGQHLIKKENV